MSGRKTLIARPEHEVAYQDLNDLLRKHADKLSKPELLAVAANLVGKIAALQDQRTMTSEQVMEIVCVNLERGNAQVVERLGDTAGSA